MVFLKYLQEYAHREIDKLSLNKTKNWCEYEELPY
jgi:hypothetical protein